MSFGEPIDGKEIESLEERTVLGAIPFRGKAVSCVLCVHDEGLVVGRGFFYTLIKWGNIFSFKNQHFLGNPVIEISVGSMESQNRIIVPWRINFNEYLPENIERIRS